MTAYGIKELFLNGQRCFVGEDFIWSPYLIKTTVLVRGDMSCNFANSLSDGSIVAEFADGRILHGKIRDVTNNIEENVMTGTIYLEITGRFKITV